MNTQCRLQRNVFSVISVQDVENWQISQQTKKWNRQTVTPHPKNTKEEIHFAKLVSVVFSQNFWHFHQKCENARNQNFDTTWRKLFEKEEKSKKQKNTNFHNLRHLWKSRSFTDWQKFCLDFGLIYFLFLLKLVEKIITQVFQFYMLAILQS